VRRELNRQMNSLRQDNEKRLSGLKGEMQTALDEVSRRALGVAPGQGKSAFAEVAWKIREVEGFVVQELQKHRADFDKKLRSKLDSEAVEEYSERISGIFEKMAKSVSTVHFCVSTFLSLVVLLRSR
jgi:hypothetical protein